MGIFIVTFHVILILIIFTGMVLAQLNALILWLRYQKALLILETSVNLIVEIMNICIGIKHAQVNVLLL